MLEHTAKPAVTLHHRIFLASGKVGEVDVACASGPATRQLCTSTRIDLATDFISKILRLACRTKNIQEQLIYALWNVVQRPLEKMFASECHVKAGIDVAPV